MSLYLNRPERACISALLVVAAAGGGCAAGRTFVLTRPTPQASFAGVRLSEGDSTAPVSDNLKRHFESSLRAALGRGGMLDAETGGSITLRYRIVGFDRGDPAGRVFNGAIQVVGVPVSGIGDGGVGVEAVYIDAHGREIGRIVADGPIAGLFGSPRGGLDQAARSIADYTKAHFTPGPLPATGRPAVADARPGGHPLLDGHERITPSAPRGLE